MGEVNGELETNMDLVGLNLELPLKILTQLKKRNSEKSPMTLQLMALR